jgi:phage baseplate assembly protein gpV
MLKFGRITEVNAKGLAKVNFEEDDFVSDFIPQLYFHTKDDQDYHSFAVREYVACLMDYRCEHGVILGAIYTESDEVPSGASAEKWIRKYKDGTIQTYDKQAHKWDLKLEDTELVITRDGYTIKRSSESLKKLLSDMLDKIIAITVPTPVGPSGVPNNASDFTAIKTRLDDLFEA